MKRFIRYLYEYEQGKRKRNVGFVKVEQDEEECTVHIHGKGLRLESGSSFRVYLFFAEEGNCTGVCQGEIGYMGPALNYRLRYTKEDTGVPENYDKVSGVLLEGPAEHTFAALWDEVSIDISHMQVWKGTAGEPAHTDTGEEEPSDADVEEAIESGRSQEDVVSLKCGNDTRDVQEHTGDTESAAETGGVQADIVSLKCGHDTRDVREHAGDTESAAETGEVQADIVSLKCGDDTGDVREHAESSIKDTGVQTAAESSIKDAGVQTAAESPGTPVWKVTKIQRKDITMLPRCEWRLANNNFLLHGYYNYRHLVLLDNGTVLKLGVPGIYHEKEARAAEGFGFPEFINADETKLVLRPEECNKEQLFGYWCRQVRRRSL